MMHRNEDHKPCVLCGRVPTRFINMARWGGHVCNIGESLACDREFTELLGMLDRQKVAGGNLNRIVELYYSDD